jgi:hypothetical protein
MADCGRRLQSWPVEVVDDDVVTAVGRPVVSDRLGQPSWCADLGLKGLLSLFVERAGQHLNQEHEPFGVVGNEGVGVDVGCEQVRIAARMPSSTGMIGGSGVSRERPDLRADFLRSCGFYGRPPGLRPVVDARNDTHRASGQLDVITVVRAITAH